MKSVSMSGSLRENVGKKDAKKNRKLGLVPCVLYGGEKQLHFTIEDKLFSKLIFTPESFIVNLNIDGKEFSTILQDVQYHPVTDNVLHADFLEIIPDRPVSIAVPIEVTGVAPGVLQGGKLHKKKRKLIVKGLLENLPDKITVDISDLDIGDSVRVEKIDIDNLEMLDPARDVVVSVKVTRVVELEEEEGEGEGEGEEGAEGEAAESTEEPAAE